jgi:hypothetical protein
MMPVMRMIALDWSGKLKGEEPHLHVLSEQGFSKLPFDAVRLSAVVEIYPRALTGPINTSRCRTACPASEPFLESAGHDA